ncbi:MAG TPA: hypothetical protein VK743_19830 [Steroidobacteraceae bacterium]|nr:hypothetical protein [Steroidobacteraceae bacterium]
MKNFTGFNSTEAEVRADFAADPRRERVERDADAARHRAGEVLRRGVFELLYLGSNLTIAGSGLLWLYQLLARKPAVSTGLILATAVALSLCAYQLARWRASASVSRQVEKLTAWLIATLGIALVWGGICFAFTFGVLRWLSAPGTASWIIGGTAGLCGLAYTIAGEWTGLRDCFAPPTGTDQDRQSDESAA